MSDPFSEFGGKPLLIEQKKDDPFSEFGGKPIVRQADPFAEFGGYADTQQEERSEYSSLRREMDKGLVDSVTESPKLISKDISDSDIKAIASKHGVNPTELRDFAPLLGASLENPTGTETRRRVVGTLGQTVALGIPQKLMRMAQTPEMERALDDIKGLSDARKSLLLGAGEILVPGGVIGAGVKGLGKKVAAGAATGATYGGSGSKQGETVEGAVTGAVLGGAIPILGSGISRVLSKAGKPLTEAEQKLAQSSRAMARGGADFEAEIVDRLQKKEVVDSLVANAVFSEGGVSSLSRKDQRAIAEAFDLPRLEKLATRVDKKTGVPLGLEKASEIISNDVIRKQASELASDIGVDATGNPLAVVRKWAGEGAASGQGLEAAVNRVKRQLSVRHINDVLDEKGVFATDRSNFLSKAADFVSDAQYVIRAMDEKLPGLGLEKAHQEINRGLNQMSYPREKSRKALTEIFLGLQKDGLDPVARDAGSIIQKVEKQAGKLTPGEKQVFDTFSSFFSQSLDNVNRIASEYKLPPLNIKPRPDYIPAALMDFDKLDVVMGDRINAILRDAGAISKKTFTDLSQVPETVYGKVLANPEHRSTLNFLFTLSKGDGTKEGGAGVSRVFKELFVNPQDRQKLESVAKAALEREDLIPTFARETDLYRLADKWNTNTLRQLFLREPTDKLRKMAEVLNKRGMSREGEYLTTLVADLNGIRKGTMAAQASRLTDSWNRWADKKIAAASPEDRIKWETVRSVPNIMSGLTKNVHANLLGANPRTVLMNLTQTFTKTIPEFNNVYGSSTAIRAAMSLARGEGMGGVNKTIQRMEQLGIMPARYVGGNLPYLAEGVSRTGAARSASAAAQISSDLIMKPFELAEKINRGLAFRMTEVFIDDLVRGSAAARKSLNNMPTATRRQVERALAAGDPQTALVAASEHIINSSQYQYNRASQSQYGRTMGPLFSQFSKWPTATMGQLVESFRTRGVGGGLVQTAQKLVVPLALLEAGDQLYLAASDQKELSPREVKLMSKSGVSAAAPIGNIKGMVTGDFFTPPVVALGMKILVEPIKGSDKMSIQDTIGRGLQEAAYQLAPGALGGWTRFITDDMVTAIEDKRPEGPGFLDRAGRLLE